MSSVLIFEHFIPDDGLVSEEEFLSWMASQGEIGGQDDDIMQDLLAAFRVFDKDGNGYITKVSTLSKRHWSSSSRFIKTYPINLLKLEVLLHGVSRKQDSFGQLKINVNYRQI